MMWFTLLTAVLAARIALIWQAKAKPSLGNDVEKGLYQFLLNASGSAHEVRAFEQQFVGDLEDVVDYLPQVVLDYSEDLFNLAANARALSSKTLFLYSNDDLRVPQPQAKPLRENKADVWSPLASSLAKHFGWEEAILLIDWSNKRTVLDTFEEPFTDRLTVGEGLEQGVYDLLATREIRKSGVHAVFLMASAAITEAMLRAFTKYGMDKGYAFVLLGSHQFDVSLYPTGVLSIALAGSEGAKSPVEVDFWYLLYALTSRPLDQWTIVNTVQGTQYTVGIFDKNNLTISPLLYFPRGLTSPPQNEPFHLFFNLNNWSEDMTVNGQRSIPEALNDFKLSTRRFTVAGTKFASCAGFDPTLQYVQCYIDCRTAQVSMLLSYEYLVEVAYQLTYMKLSGLIIPYLSSEFVSSYATSTKDFPYFLRVVQDELSITPHAALVVKWLGNVRKILTYYNPNFGDNGYNALLDFFRKTGIQIVNPESTIKIDETDPGYYKTQAQFIKESGLRPIMLLPIFEQFKKFHLEFEKVGLKDEDMVIVALTNRCLDILNHLDDEDDAIFLKYIKSYVFSDYTTYSGEFVGEFQQRMKDNFGIATSQDCISYDLGTLAVKTLDFMIIRGLDFYDWKDTMFAMRGIRFSGCTGRIQFSSDDNNRSSLDYDHTQCRVTYGKVDEVKIFRTSITGQSYFTYSDFVWFDDTSTIPKQNRLNEVDCPFPEEYRQDSDQSTDLTIALNWAVVGLCVVMNVATYFGYVRRTPFLDNEEAITLSTQDNIVLASTFIEPLVFDLVSPGINVYALIMGTSIDSRLDWSDGKYFNLLNWIYAFAGAALVTSVTCACNKFKPLAIDLQLLTAFIVRALFFVFAFILLSTLDCNESHAAGDLELSDAFMDIDCYTQCWTGDHKKYAIASVVVLAGLVVLCSTLSSHLTNSLEGLQVYVNPTTELVRKSFLLIVIALYKSRPRLSTAAHYTLYLGTLTVYSAVCIKLRVLSIPLLSSYFNLLILLLLFMNVCEVLASEVYSSTVMWICLGGGLGLALLGLVLYRMRKLPKLLIPTRKIDTEALFRFAFRRNQIFPANRFLPDAESSQSQRENLYLAS
jgi:hypothetical protein